MILCSFRPVAHRVLYGYVYNGDGERAKAYCCRFPSNVPSVLDRDPFAIQKRILQHEFFCHAGFAIQKHMILEKRNRLKKGPLNAPLGLFHMALYRTAYNPTLQPPPQSLLAISTQDHPGPLPKHTKNPASHLDCYLPCLSVLEPRQTFVITDPHSLGSPPTRRIPQSFFSVPSAPRDGNRTSRNHSRTPR